MAPPDNNSNQGAAASNKAQHRARILRPTSPLVLASGLLGAQAGSAKDEDESFEAEPMEDEYTEAMASAGGQNTGSELFRTYAAKGSEAQATERQRQRQMMETQRQFFGEQRKPTSTMVETEDGADVFEEGDLPPSATLLEREEKRREQRQREIAASAMSQREQKTVQKLEEDKAKRVRKLLRGIEKQQTTKQKIKAQKRKAKEARHATRTVFSAGLPFPLGALLYLNAELIHDQKLFPVFPMFPPEPSVLRLLGTLLADITAAIVLAVMTLWPILLIVGIFGSIKT